MKAPMKYIIVLQHTRDQKATLCQKVSQSVTKWHEATQNNEKRNILKGQ